MFINTGGVRKYHARRPSVVNLVRKLPRVTKKSGNVRGAMRGILHRQYTCFVVLEPEALVAKESSSGESITGDSETRRISLL